MHVHKSMSRYSLLRAVLPLFLLFSFACNNEVGAGPKAPDFSLENLKGEKVTLKEYRGKVVLLDFWATWCPPCRYSIPGMVKMQEKYKDKGLVVLGISMDDPRKADNKYIREFCEKYEVNYVVLRSDENVVKSYFGNGGVAIPTVFVIDREGKVKEKFVGADEENIVKTLEELLK